MNQWVGIGNATKDAELRTTQTGISVCTFTIAVNPKVKREGEEDRTEFFKVTAWRKLAENCGKYVKKGMKVSVVGSIGHDEYTDNKGEKRFNLTVTANDVEFLSRVEGSSQQEDYSQAPEVPQSQSTPNGYTDVSADYNTEDLPF